MDAFLPTFASLISYFAGIRGRTRDDFSKDSANSRGNWKAAEFKQYNFAAAGQPTEGGALHPLLKVREEFRQIFFDMG